jgi:uncharacterized membrane protein
MKQYVTVGIAVIAGAALIEAALIPGIVIGGAAVLAPRLLTKALPLLRRRKARTASRQQNEPATGQPLTSLLPKLGVGQAIAKTITYRLIVTSLDFTTNYIVIGELATAAGLSTVNLIAGPLFYFAHEAGWNYLAHREPGVELLAPGGQKAEPAGIEIGGFTVSPALAKTVTFRTLASIMDFTMNFVVVGNVGQAAILSATGFVFGPFIYYGHEKAWEYFGGAASDVATEPRLLPKLLPKPLPKLLPASA